MVDTPIPADQLARVGPQRQAAISWSLAVDARLERLLTLAEAAGERTTRKEIAAALVAAAPESGEELSVLIRKYRLSTVRDLLPVAEGANVVAFAHRRPGPRTSLTDSTVG